MNDYTVVGYIHLGDAFCIPCWNAGPQRTAADNAPVFAGMEGIEALVCDDCHEPFVSIV